MGGVGEGRGGGGEEGAGRGGGRGAWCCLLSDCGLMRPALLVAAVASTGPDCADIEAVGADEDGDET